MTKVVAAARFRRHKKTRRAQHFTPVAQYNLLFRRFPMRAELSREFKIYFLRACVRFFVNYRTPTSCNNNTINPRAFPKSALAQRAYREDGSPGFYLSLSRKFISAAAV